MGMRGETNVTVHYMGETNENTLCNETQKPGGQKIWWVIKGKPFSRDSVNCPECIRLYREEKRITTTKKTTQETEEAVA